MKPFTKTYSIIVLITMLVLSTTSFSQSICDDIKPFCSGTSYVFPNVFDGLYGPDGPDYGCSGFEKNPVWYYLKIGQAGTLELTIHQQDLYGVDMDVDFAMWGPFNDVTTGCNQVSDGNAIPIQWSYSIAGIETLGLGV